MSIGEIENKKVPHGEVTLVGLGRLGFRTALNLMQIHRGGPVRINVIDGQKISYDDLIFRSYGGEVGEFKVTFLKRLAGSGFSKNIISYPENISEENLGLLSGSVICIEIAGGDTLPTTAAIIRKAKEIEAFTISTMGVFGIGNEEIIVTDIAKGDPENPIVSYLTEKEIRNHTLIGTGKLIRDWEPVTPAILDRISVVICSEILKMLHNDDNKDSNC